VFYQREDAGTGHVSDLLEWGAMVAGPTPTVIENKDGSYMTTLAYRGEDVAMLEPEARAVYLQRLNGALMRLGSGWGLLFDQWHEATTAYPESPWTNPTACFVDAARRALFTSGALYEDQQFLTLCWQPTQPAKARWNDQVFQTRPTETSDTRYQDLDAFVHAVTRWSDGLTGLLPAWHWLDPEETLTYLRWCVSWARERVRLPVLPTDLAARLACEDFLPGHTPKLGDHYLRPLDIQQWPSGQPEDGGGLGMDVPLALQGLPFPYRYTVRYVPLDRDEAERVLRDYQRKWANLVKEVWPAVVQFAFPGAAPTHTSSVGRALQSLLAHDVHYGYTTVTVLVWSETEAELAQRERATVKALQGAGLVVAKESINACQAWVGMQPGDLTHNVRQPLLPSLGVAFLLPHATVWAGDERDAHLDGPPLLTASSDGVPFRFVLHPGASELGNTMALGPSRSGKSGVLGLMMSQFWRYQPTPQVFCFDKDYALYACTLLHGGVHYDLGGEASLGLQPLGRLDLGEQEQRWATQWLGHVLQSQGLTLAPEDREQLWVAVQRLAAFPAPMRTLTGYAECLQDQRLKRALAPFLTGGPYAFLDAEQDAIGDHDWTTLEMRKLLDMPDAIPHVLRYRFHRMSERFDGRPTLIVLDESRKLLADPVFGPEILDFLKERAKVNVSVILSTQEIADAASTAAWQAIQASCKTWLYLPNKAATHPPVAAFYKDCGLTEMQIQLLALSTPKQDYLYKSDAGMRRFQLVLSPVERALVAASTLEEITAFRALTQEIRKESLVAAWLRHQSLGLEAAIYTQHYDREVSHDRTPL
jgi:type IV secretion/conjugal transfer VirB4 family ATPase